MARHYGSIVTAIWRDPDFRALPSGHQRLYILLITQADITPAGTLPLTMRRWADMAPDTALDPSILADALAGLRSRGYVVVDETEEMVLIRTFVKHDNGLGNEKRRRAINSAAETCQSSLIRRCLAFEFAKLGHADHALTDAPWDALSDEASDERRVVVTEVGTSHNPQPATRNPGTGNRRASAADSPIADPWLFSEFWDRYPRRVGKVDARRAWDRALKRGADPDRIVSVADRMAKDPNLPAEHFIPHPTTWLNRDGWEDPPYPDERAARPTEATGTSRARDILAAAERMTTPQRPQIGS